MQPWPIPQPGALNRETSPQPPSKKRLFSAAYYRFVIYFLNLPIQGWTASSSSQSTMVRYKPGRSLLVSALNVRAIFGNRVAVVADEEEVVFARGQHDEHPGYVDKAHVQLADDQQATSCSASISPYLERQVEALCGIHALNNDLGEAIFTRFFLEDQMNRKVGKGSQTMQEFIV